MCKYTTWIMITAVDDRMINKNTSIFPLNIEIVYNKLIYQFNFPIINKPTIFILAIRDFRKYFSLSHLERDNYNNPFRYNCAITDSFQKSVCLFEKFHAPLKIYSIFSLKF